METEQEIIHHSSPTHLEIEIGVLLFCLCIWPGDPLEYFHMTCSPFVRIRNINVLSCPGKAG